MTLSEAQSRLAEVEAAIHRLMVGASVVEVEALDGSRVRYQAAQLSDLQKYRAELESKIAALAAGTTAARRSVYATF
jgi:outer membrane murein-binding lipoprotein Lpp